MAGEYQRVTIQKFDREDAGTPVVYAHLYHDPDNVSEQHPDKIGRVEVVASTVSEEGAELTFRREGNNWLYWNDSDKGFDLQHGAEVGFLDEEIRDGRVLLRSAHIMTEDPKPWFIRSKALEGLSRGLEHQWASGDQAPSALKNILGSTGLTGTAIHDGLYYGLAVAAEEKPVVVEPEMMIKTAEQLSILIQARIALENSLLSNERLGEQIEEVAASELPRIADAEFMYNRRQAHDNEKRFHELARQSAFDGMRLFLPVGQGRSGRTWPYMDASSNDEVKAFGYELNDLRARSRIYPRQSLKQESKELKGRIEFLDKIYASLRELHKKETKD